MTESTSTAPWVVVGLGNPGDRYARNRHNVGAMVVGELARRSAATLRSHKARCSAAQVRLGTPGGRPGPAAVIAVPHSYMNESGGPVQALLGFYGAGPDRLVVVHDELDIDPGLVRVGIGRPPGRMEAADFVLRDFSSAERADLPFLVDDAADAVELVTQEGLLAAQQRYHSPR